MGDLNWNAALEAGGVLVSEPLYRAGVGAFDCFIFGSMPGVPKDPSFGLLTSF